jgi:hypothetical protein
MRCLPSSIDTALNGTYVPEWVFSVACFAYFKIGGRGDCNNIQKKFRNTNVEF